MKDRGLKPVDRARQRAVDHRGVRSDKSPRVANARVYAEGQACMGCGAVYSRKTWRREGRRMAHTVSLMVEKTTCPACTQMREHRAYGRVVMRGRWLRGHEDQVRRRIANVEARARHTQPERRVVEIVKGKDGLEVRSTSQKLAHRLVREMEKAFGGRSTYRWSDNDGSLDATWARD